MSSLIDMLTQQLGGGATRQISSQIGADEQTTGKAMAHCRDLGLLCWKVETWNHAAKKRYDLFHFGDVLAITPGGILAIQACGDDVAAHIRKVTEDEVIAGYLRAWLEAGGSFELWAFRRRKFRRKDRSWSKSFRWRLTRFTFEAAPGGVFWEEISEDPPPG